MAGVKGLTVAIGADTRGFNRALRSANSEIKSTTSSVRNLGKSLELEWDSNKFEQAQKKAQQAIEQTDEKVLALRSQLSHMEEAGDVDSAQYAKLEEELNYAERTALELKLQLEEIRDMKVDQLAKKFEDIGDSVSGVGRALTPVSAAAGALLASFGAMGVSAARTSKDLQTMGQMFNMSAEEIQRFNYLALQTNISQSAMQNALRQTSMRLGKMAEGELNSATRALERLGITTEDASKGVGKNFEVIINQLASMEDVAERAYLANEIFGTRMGSQMIPMLEMGVDGLAMLSAEFENVGYMTTEQVEKMAAFNDVMDRIIATFKAIKNEIGTAMLPVMQNLADLIEEKIIPTVKKFSEWFGRLSDSQKNTIAIILTLTAAMAPLLLVGGKMIGMIGSSIRSLYAMNKALWVLAANPVVAIIAIIVGLLVYMIATNEELRKSLLDLVGTIGKSLAPILELVMGLFNALFRAISPLLDILAKMLIPVIKIISTQLEVQFRMIGKVANIISKILIPIVNGLADVFEFVFGFISNGIDLVVKGMEWLVNKVIDFVNIMIKSINSIGGLIGVQLKEIEAMSLSAEVKSESLKTATPEDTISTTESTLSPHTVINNDYSAKDIKFEIIIQNYADEVDVDDLVRKINLKLAEEM